ncbi:MAG: hypothetical protein K2Y29_09645 [Beijerinckiaceae bacterium]|nr:hypothetical protein [Beijerinckiaceae bacterium]
MFLRHSSSSRALIAAAGAALIVGLAATTPARALDDGAENIFSSIAGLLTSSFKTSEAKPQIEYRERAPLVLPPNMQQLPPPGSGVAARNPAWPQDFDIQRQNKQAARDRRPRDTDALDRTPMPVGATPVVGPGNPNLSDCGEDSLARLCNPEQFWKTMRTTRTTDTQQVAVGQEPTRRSLTDPPTGFRRQATEQRYTFEVERKVELSDARAQALEEQRRKQAISEGRNPNF